jgi:RNAse (barnase) inhibitor barstar
MWLRRVKRHGQFVSLCMVKKTITICGSNFSDLETFFVEIDRVLTTNLPWKTGHNLNSFNDLLRGGFGVYEYEEPVNIIWKDLKKSENALGQDLVNNLRNIILDHSHIDFATED